MTAQDEGQMVSNFEPAQKPVVFYNYNMYTTNTTNINLSRLKLEYYWVQ